MTTVNEIEVYVYQLSLDQLRRVAVECIERLIESEEVRLAGDDMYDSEDEADSLGIKRFNGQAYWEASGALLGG